tara:strand:+ start:589 stop:1986 length:1398 start_codon:yes stop_codon:yes gene_type:complete
MGNARNLANLLSGGDTQITAADLDDDSITADKLASASVTNAKVSNSTLDASTKLTGTLGISQGGSGLTSLGTAGQALKVNDGGTAFEFGSVTTDLTPIQKDIAILSLTDNINQNRGFHNLANAITDTYENEDQVTAKSNVNLANEGFTSTVSAGDTTSYINPFGTTGTSNTFSGETIGQTVTVTTGTGAWESGGTSFTYVDMVSSAVGSGHMLLPQGTTYDWKQSKVVIVLQQIVKAGGSGPNHSWSVIKGVATDWTSYASPSTRADGGRSGISFNAGTSNGNQMRFTYDPVTNQDVVVSESRSTNSGTWTGGNEGYGTAFTSEDVADEGVVYGATFWSDGGANWTVRMWFSVEESTPSASGSYESTATTISSAVDEMSAVVLYKDTIGTATLNTDFKVSVSSDNGSNFTQLTLTDTGLLFSTGVKIATSNKVSTTSGTQLKYKVEFANQGASKKTECSGVSMIY